MKTILVPTDFSPNALHALNFAAELAKRAGAQIILIHAFDIMYTNSYVPFEIIAGEIYNEKERSDKELGFLARKIRSRRIRCKIRSEYDGTVEAILKLCRNERADVIIMGTQGASNAAEALFGTNTSAVIEKATCPVISVPEHCRFSGFQSVILATEYNVNDAKILKRINDLFFPIPITLSLVHVPDDSETNCDESMNRFIEEVIAKTGLQIRARHILPKGDPEAELEKFTEEKCADLLVVCPRHHTLFQKIFGKSLSRKLSYHTHTPLMTIHG